MKFLYVVIAIVFFALSGDYLMGIKPRATPDEYGHWALALLVLNLLPSLHYLIFRRKNIPFIPIVGLFYVLEFALPVFYIKLTHYQLGVLDIRSLQYAFFGLLLFYTGYYFAFSWLKHIKPFAPVKMAYAENVKFVKILMWAFLVASLVGKVSESGALRHFYDPSIYICSGLFLLLLLKRKLNIGYSLVFGSLMMLEFIIRFTTSLLGQSARFVLFLTMMYYLVSRRIPYMAIIGVVIIYSLIIPVKFEYRDRLVDEPEMPIQERFELFTTLAIENYTAKQRLSEVNSEKPEEDEDHPLWRFSYSASALSRVIIMTPAFVPYWDGYTYSTLYSKFIPRFLWPNKPRENVGQMFGHRYNILDNSDSITSMNLPWIAELYANYGRNAVFYGMLLFGLLFGFIDRFYNSSVNLVNVLISSAIYFRLIQHESNFALTAGNVFLLTVAIYVFVTFLQKNMSIKKGNGMEISGLNK